MRHAVRDLTAYLTA